MKPPRTLGISSGLGSMVRQTEQPMSIDIGDRRLRYGYEQQSKVLSNISFGTTPSNADADQNMQVWKATGVSPGAANTEFSVSHNLTHVPFGFMVVSVDKVATIIKSTTAWTAATSTSLGSIFLKTNAATVTFTLIIV